MLRPSLRFFLHLGCALGLTSLLHVPAWAAADDAARQEMLQVTMLSMKLEYQSLVEHCEQRRTAAAPRARLAYTAWLGQNQPLLKTAEAQLVPQMKKDGSSLEKELQSVRQRHDKEFAALAPAQAETSCQATLDAIRKDSQGAR